MLVDLFPTQIRSLAKLYGDIIFVNFLAKLCREVLNGLGEFAAFFPAPHQPRTLVCCSRHRGSGGITAGSFFPIVPLPFVVSSIWGVTQILFQRGTQHFPVLQPPGLTEASLRASVLKLGVEKRGNTLPSAKRYLCDSLYTTKSFVRRR